MSGDEYLRYLFSGVRVGEFFGLFVCVCGWFVVFGVGWFWVV